MKSKSILKIFSSLALCLSLAACEKKFNPADGTPPPTQVLENGNGSVVTVDKFLLFRLPADAWSISKHASTIT